jgi:hypothetical protein
LASAPAATTELEIVDDDAAVSEHVRCQFDLARLVGAEGRQVCDRGDGPSMQQRHAGPPREDDDLAPGRDRAGVVHDHVGEVGGTPAVEVGGDGLVERAQCS